jgi:orotate phosphoribosyltransferase
MTRQELARAIYAVSHITGTFRLRSGAESTEYFDKYRFEADPKLLRAICTAMVPLIPPTAEVLAGLELGGVPIATVLADLTGLPVTFVRKAAKTYGTCALAEGTAVAGRRLVIVEDVVTSGGQVALSAQDLRALGATAAHALCVIDRESGGREKLAEAGIELRALFGFAELKMAGALAAAPDQFQDSPRS